MLIVDVQLTATCGWFGVQRKQTTFLEDSGGIYIKTITVLQIFHPLLEAKGTWLCSDIKFTSICNSWKPQGNPLNVQSLLWNQLDEQSLAQWPGLPHLKQVLEFGYFTPPSAAVRWEDDWGQSLAQCPALPHLKQEEGTELWILLVEPSMFG